ncbi:MAG: hypothetical protein ACTSRI_21920, partial [Promethearchaeota archaeon]
MKISEDFEKFKQRMEYGVISPPHWFSKKPELYLPVDLNYLKTDKLSKIIKLFLDQVKICLAIEILVDKKTKSIIIGDSIEFAVEGISEGTPVVWDALKQSIIEDKEIRAKFSMPPGKLRALEERFYQLRLQEKRRYIIKQESFGILRKFGFFSLGDLELILPLDLSSIKLDEIHQNLKKMLGKMNVFMGFSFDYLDDENKLVLVDMISFNVDGYRRLKWDMRSLNFEEVDFKDIILKKGQQLQPLQKTSSIYISYSTLDSNKYKVASIAHKLETLPEIKGVLFWEEDMDDDIIQYMDENIAKCDLFVLFCSEN